MSHQWVQLLEDNQLSIPLPPSHRPATPQHLSNGSCRDADVQDPSQLLQSGSIASVEAQQSLEEDLRLAVEDKESGTTITAPTLVWVPVSVLASPSRTRLAEQVTVQISGNRIQRPIFPLSNSSSQRAALPAQPSVKCGTSGGGTGGDEGADLVSLDVCVSYSLACGRSCSRKLQLPVRAAFRIVCQVGARRFYSDHTVATIWEFLFEDVCARVRCLNLDGWVEKVQLLV